MLAHCCSAHSSSSKTPSWSALGWEIALSQADVDTGKLVLEVGSVAQLRAPCNMQCTARACNMHSYVERAMPRNIA